MSSYFYDKLIELGADGIDFIEFSPDMISIKDGGIVKTVTKEDFQAGVQIYIPKTSYMFWVMKDNKKVYIY